VPAVVALLAAVTVALAVLLVRRVRVRASLEAAADAEGTWSAAGGGAVGPLAFTAGVSPRGTAWSAHVLGRTVARSSPGPRARSGEAAPGLTPARAWDLSRAALRHVRFDRLDARVHGAADDPATSAIVAGWLAAASAVVAPGARVATDVDWLADQPFVHVDCDLEASFVPLLLGWDVARIALRRSP
jgi:hypothetical protein